MRRITIALLVALALVGLAGCAQRPAGHERKAIAPVAATPAARREAQVYGAVLHRYLGTPSENSFPAGTFKVIYVMDHAYPDAASPTATISGGVPISADDQEQIVAIVGGTVPVHFVGDRNSVIDRKDGCGTVANGGILVTLGTLTSAGDNSVEVPINGYVACLGATWLTYVVRHDASGWHVTGTTGSAAIS